jgi:8-oxo-dGTP pyrophosphatase MutT (NUDIX family)
MTASPVPPRDAASLVIVRHVAGQAQVLLGKRRSTQVFAPGKLVFPGGSLDAADHALNLGEQLAAHHRAPLLAEQAGHRPEAFALAALRETFEEAGLVFGTSRSAPPPSATGGWPAYFATGYAPSLAPLSFIARAITPPGRSRRFDARFFLVAADAAALDTGTTDGEFEQLLWLPMAEAGNHGLHSMTKIVVDEALAFLALGADARQAAPVPFFFEDAAGWRRAELKRELGIKRD